MRGRKRVTVCVGCNASFEALLVKLKNGKGKFCSRKCYNTFRSKNKQDSRKLDVFYQKKHKYGLSKEDYLGLFKLQNNCCKICKVSFGKRKAYVDHNHRTKKVRGLLCNNCNSVLGMAGDNIRILESAIKYLKVSDD